MFELIEETKTLKKTFPKFFKAYSKVKPELSDEILFDIAFFFRERRNFDEVNSWTYQYLKKDIEREVFKKSLSIGGKIEGLDILPATQFFTEDYMTEFLVSESLETYNSDELKKIRVLDPACGGGNFLISAFDKLIQIYREHNIFDDDNERVQHILTNQLLGYDLDQGLVEIAKLGLFIKASKYRVPFDFEVNLFKGNSDSMVGFLDYRYKRGENKLPDHDRGLKSLFTVLNSSENSLVVLTNPPFMGPRDMDVQLRTYLQRHYPSSKGDLCVAFMIRCSDILKSNDCTGLVTQTSWMHLTSFGQYRKDLLENNFIRKCLDLGTGAFSDLGGAKTNVSLSIIEKVKPKKQESQFVNLRYLKHPKKSSCIKNRTYHEADVFRVKQSDFLCNSNNEILYLLSGTIKEKFNRFGNYSDYANPMQGTSTGDNTTFIKYHWEESSNKDWVLVSKGGGYCKWEGLNYYRVKWGEDAQHIKENTGSAIRNLDKIKSTQLVYSDTGTLGLNVRVLLPNQVFIASGPGIQVLKGSEYAHMAYLNSRVSTFFLKVLSPKLTTSAGYIGKIPMNDEMAHSLQLSKLAKKCVDLKSKFLKNKITNYEYSSLNFSEIFDLENYLNSQILLDLELELKRLDAENKIETLVRENLNLSETEITEIEHLVGISSYQIENRKISINIDELDNIISDSIDLNCVFSSKKTRGFQMGCDGLLEFLAYNYGIHPKTILSYLSKNLDSLYHTRQKYVQDLLHKIVLVESGYYADSKFQKNENQVNISSQLHSKYGPVIAAASHYGIIIDDWFPKVFNEHHSQSFKGRPLLKYIHSTNTHTIVFV
jgi:hypothetical protein